MQEEPRKFKERWEQELDELDQEKNINEEEYLKRLDKIDVPVTYADRIWRLSFIMLGVGFFGALVANAVHSIFSAYEWLTSVIELTIPLLAIAILSGIVFLVVCWVYWKKEGFMLVLWRFIITMWVVLLAVFAWRLYVVFS